MRFLIASSFALTMIALSVGSFLKGGIASAKKDTFHRYLWIYTGIILLCIGTLLVFQIGVAFSFYIQDSFPGVERRVSPDTLPVLKESMDAKRILDKLYI